MVKLAWDLWVGHDIDCWVDRQIEQDTVWWTDDSGLILGGLCRQSFIRVYV